MAASLATAWLLPSGSHPGASSLADVVAREIAERLWALRMLESQHVMFSDGTIEKLAASDRQPGQTVQPRSIGRIPRLAGHVLRLAALVLFLAGCGLLLLNVVGIFRPMRNNAIYQDRVSSFKNDITLTEAQVLSQIPRRPGESDGHYLRRLNQVMNRGFAHYWLAEGADKYYLHVPPFENYLLYLLGLRDPAQFGQYEFSNYRRAIERGAGLCSQQALALAGALRSQGMEAQIAGLGGHVVVRARVGQGWWLADPDYGVVIARDLYVAEKDPRLVAAHYRDVVFAMRENAESPSHLLRRIQRIYAKPGNYVYGDAAEYFGAAYLEREDRYYRLIWTIPFAAMLPYVLLSGVKWLLRHKPSQLTQARCIEATGRRAADVASDADADN